MSEDSHLFCCSGPGKVNEEVKRIAPGHKSKLAGRLFRVVISYLVSGACLFWVFHDVTLAQVLHSMAGVSWGWIALGIILQIVAYFCVAWQWQLLLQPAGRLSIVRATQAVFAGRFANDVLPVQLGYVIRAYLASRWIRIGLPAVIPSLLVERLWDGFWLALGIGLATVFIPLPADLLRARNILIVLVVVGVVAVVVLAYRQKNRSVRRPQSTASHWQPVQKCLFFIERMVDGTREIARSHLLPAVVGLALLKLMIQALAYFAIMWAYGFRLSIWAGMAVFLIAYLGICIPSTPASVGVFQIFSIAGLEIFGVAKAAATGFSLVAFVALTVPLTIIGFFALAQSGMTLRQIRTEADRLGRNQPSG